MPPTPTLKTNTLMVRIVDSNKGVVARRPHQVRPMARDPLILDYGAKLIRTRVLWRVALALDFCAYYSCLEAENSPQDYKRHPRTLENLHPTV